MQKNFPNSIPKFYVFDYPENIDHIYEDGNVCLATIGEMIYFLHKNPSLIAFINKFINSFIYTLDWFDKYKTYPFGDRKHGYRGLLDYYLNDLNLNKEQYKAMVFIIYNDMYRGHMPCICGSGKRLRSCHGKYILPIITNALYKREFLYEASMILTEDGKMSEKNPQNNDFIMSKRFAIAQDIFGVIAFILAIFQGITLVIPNKSFLVIAGTILMLEYISAHYKSSFFDKGHRIREIGLIDNSFDEKRIPNYNSEDYYNNAIIIKNEIKLLVNIHENSLFTLNIAKKMSYKYYLFSAIAFLFFTFKLFISGMDDYTSLLLGFIVSSSLVDRAIKLNTLKKISEEVYEKANEICNIYEKSLAETSMLLPKIIDVLLLYENAIFETKIILSEIIFNQLNTLLSKEWLDIRDNYLIYKNQSDIKK